MTCKTLISAALAVTLAFSGTTFAQGRDTRNDGNDRNHDNRPRGEQGPRAAPRGMQPDRRDNDRRPDMRNDGYRNMPGRGYGPPQVRYDRGAGPNHAYYPGQRLPAYYRSRSYVVEDWRGHRLSAPPRGYHWVQTGGDYVLVAIATGIILQLLLNN